MSMPAAVPRIVAASGFAALVLLPVPALAQENERAEALLAQLPFSDSERRQILAGKLVTTASREQTSDHELAITNFDIDGKPTIAWRIAWSRRRAMGRPWSPIATTT
jgi:hypothetical protein